VSFDWQAMYSSREFAFNLFQQAQGVNDKVLYTQNVFSSGSHTFAS
jgi:hypothetical protein